MKRMAIFKSKFNKNNKLIEIKVKKEPARIGWQYQMNIYIFFFQLST